MEPQLAWPLSLCVARSAEDLVVKSVWDRPCVEIRGRRLVLLRGLRFRPVCLVLRIMGGSGSGDVNVGCISVEVASDMMTVLGKDGGAVVMRGG